MAPKSFMSRWDAAVLLSTHEQPRWLMGKAGAMRLCRLCGESKRNIVFSVPNPQNSKSTALVDSTNPSLHAVG